MISIVIAVLAFGTYLAGWYELTFWVLVFAIGNGIFWAIRALREPPVYHTIAAAAGVAMSVATLVSLKTILIAGFAAAAWRMADAAGYL